MCVLSRSGQRWLGVASLLSVCFSSSVSASVSISILFLSLSGAAFARGPDIGAPAAIKSSIRADEPYASRASIGMGLKPPMRSCMVCGRRTTTTF